MTQAQNGKSVYHFNILRFHSLAIFLHITLTSYYNFCSRLKEGVDIIVSTPQRILDMAKRGEISLSTVSCTCCPLYFDNLHPHFTNTKCSPVGRILYS